MNRIQNEQSRHRYNARRTSTRSNDNTSTSISRRNHRFLWLLMLVTIPIFLLEVHTLRNAYAPIIIDGRLVGESGAFDGDADTDAGDDAAVDPILAHRTLSKYEQDAEASTFQTNNTSTSTTPTGDHNNTHGFHRYDGVVIVTKVLSSSVQTVSSWLCFISHAYNDKMKYDVVIFTTTPWTNNQIQALQAIAAPANFKVTVALEGPPLEEQLAAMPKEELRSLRERCGIAKDNHTQALTWYHHCTEKGPNGANNLGYAWQAEFRSYQIWNHPAIQPYKYMMWFDTDAYATKEWDVDPMKAMVENDLVVLYSGFPYGRTRNDNNLRDKLIHSYGSSICHIQQTQTREDVKGKKGWEQGDILKMKPCNNSVVFSQIAGSHHITNLEVFRKDVHQQFLKNFTGDYRFSRKYDDQVSFISFRCVALRFITLCCISYRILYLVSRITSFYICLCNHEGLVLVNVFL